MQVFSILMFLLAAVLTIAPVFIKRTKLIFVCLIIQSICLGLAEIGTFFAEFSGSSHKADSDLHIPSIVIDLVFCLLIAPSLIYLAISKTEDAVDELPFKVVLVSVFFLVVIGLFSIALLHYLLSFQIHNPDLIVFCFFLICCSILLILTRKDVIKILIGTIFIENALFPLLIEASFLITILLGLLTIFINLVGVHVVIAGYQEYHSIYIDVWKGG